MPAGGTALQAPSGEADVAGGPSLNHEGTSKRSRVGDR